MSRTAPVWGLTAFLGRSHGTSLTSTSTVFKTCVSLTNDPFPGKAKCPPVTSALRGGFMHAPVLTHMKVRSVFPPEFEGQHELLPLTTKATLVVSSCTNSFKCHNRLGMRIVIKTRDIEESAKCLIVAAAEKAGLYNLRENEDLEVGYTIPRDENDKRVLLHINPSDSWKGVIYKCINFMLTYKEFLIFLCNEVETYFDIGVDLSELGSTFYNELTLPADLIHMMGEVKISYCITLYNDEP